MLRHRAFHPHTPPCTGATMERAVTAWLWGWAHVLPKSECDSYSRNYSLSSISVNDSSVVFQRGVQESPHPQYFIGLQSVRNRNWMKSDIKLCFAKLHLDLTIYHSVCPKQVTMWHLKYYDTNVGKQTILPPTHSTRPGFNQGELSYSLAVGQGTCAGGICCQSEGRYILIYQDINQMIITLK